MEGTLKDCEETYACVWKIRHRDMPCPLHDPSPGKDVPTFREAVNQVSAARGDRRFHLYGVIFPASLSDFR
jgi:hypothetical protein